VKLGLSQRVEIHAKIGERRDCLDQQWTRLLEGFGYCPVLLPNLLEDLGRYIEALGIEGIILTGGNDLAHVTDPRQPAPERDATETRLIDWAVGSGTPLLGVCRGMQMLASHYGTPLTKIEGHVARDHEVERVEGSILPLAPRETTNSYHDYGINPEDLSDVFCVEAVDSEGKIEALRHRSAKLYGIMWHPERGSTSKRDERILEAVFRGSSASTSENKRG
jgi:gamma-glutamyl-gamma-aminobutyrate hydrolase PuuD